MRRAIALVLASLAAALCSSSCASSPQPDGKTRITTILAPDQNLFEQSVSPVLERRCASLDCHGQVGRPLRIYSARGLRLPNDAGLIPGTGATTTEETTANYRAVIGLEPEQLTRVMAGLDVPRSLLLLKKPLGLESHKGGSATAPVIAPTNDPVELCIDSWIYGQIDAPSCTKAAAQF